MKISVCIPSANFPITNLFNQAQLKEFFSKVNDPEGEFKAGKRVLLQGFHWDLFLRIIDWDMPECKASFILPTNSVLIEMEKADGKTVELEFQYNSEMSVDDIVDGITSLIETFCEKELGIVSAHYGSIIRVCRNQQSRSMMKKQKI